MLFGLMTAIATFTGCESKQPAGELPRIDLTATYPLGRCLAVRPEREVLALHR